MQTTFTAEQLTDPAIQSSNQVLRTCVHCGLCTATCPTFVLLGDELDLPARPHLPDQGHARERAARDRGGRPPRRSLPVLPGLHEHLPVRRELHAPGRPRADLYRGDLRPPGRPALLRNVLARVLPRPRLFRLALMLARAARPLRAPAAAPHPAGQQLTRMLDLAPAMLPPASPMQGPQVHQAESARRGRVALLVGCAQTVLDPAINEATIRLLTRIGIEVVIPRQVGCCGALTHHMGKHDARDGQRPRRDRRLDARDRGRGAGRDRDQHVGLRHDGEGLRLHVPQRAGPRGGRARLRADQGYLGIPGRDRLRAHRPAPGPARHLPRRLQPAARAAA